MGLSMKQLDERLTIVEDSVGDMWLGFRALSERVTFAEQSQKDGAVTQDDLYEIRVAVINALYNQRSQGAYNMAELLSARYFPGENVQQIGDTILSFDSLHSAGKQEE